jgi:hypothetical protein
MTCYAGMDAKPSRHQPGSGRQAGGVRAVIIAEANSFTGDAIYIRRGVAVISITSKMIGTKSIQI